jgi:hypothetical protein
VSSPSENVDDIWNHDDFQDDLFRSDGVPTKSPVKAPTKPTPKVPTKPTPKVPTPRPVTDDVIIDDDFVGPDDNYAYLVPTKRPTKQPTKPKPTTCRKWNWKCGRTYGPCCGSSLTCTYARKSRDYRCLTCKAAGLRCSRSSDCCRGTQCIKGRNHRFKRCQRSRSG